MAKERKIKGTKVRDSGDILNLQYNEKAGAEKNMDVGGALIPLNAETTPTTAANAAAVAVGAGKTLALYNNAAAVASVTIGDSTVVSQAPGAVQAGKKWAGIPVPPNSWHRVSMGENTHIITSAATLLVFIVEDDTYIQ